MEKHYERQLADLRNKAEKTEETAQQAWSSMQTATTVKSELEETCGRYRQQLEESQGHLHSALTGCSLLIGSLLAYRAQIAELISERDLLMRQISRFDGFKRQLEEFVSAVSSTMENHGKGSTKLHSLLTFRKGVIAVIAANRIRHLASSRTLDQQTSPPSTDQAVVLPLIIWPPCLNSERRMAFGSLHISYHSQVVWIGQEELITVLHKTMDQLKTTSYAQAQQVLDQVLSRVETILCLQSSSRSHSSSLETISILKKQLVSFTKRLHAAEVERRSLRIEVSRMRDETNSLTQAQQRADVMERQLLDVNAKMKDFVAKTKFDSICDELARALKREEEAQTVLNQQSDQLEELNLRLNVQTTNEIEKERTIAEAVQGLSDVTMDLKRREQTIHQLKRQVINLEEEKQELRDRTREAENIIKIKTKDKDALVLYLKSLEASVEKARRNLMHKPDSQSYQLMFNQLLTSAAMSNLDLKEPEASTVQSLLQAFTDAQKTAVNKISMLEEEIASHKQHISSLKKEVSAVCRRERDSDEVLRSSGDPSAFLSAFPSLSNKMMTGQPQSYSYQPERSYGEDFAPLREAMDYSTQTTPSSKRQTFDL
ncbi:putative coiled-coil domain-containing protein [Apostichopus japonicus]|uniref:Putative coiled-coil domain-containing protein n=1 Tax=Stichopus japonicus TaxID=307972 RepID=A0A2G8LLL0_STIJA|nr:putative coiled-coil domain-containing protein [Apostichopus japonicus]